jgi:Fe-Mn family superoxide dismutase
VKVITQRARFCAAPGKEVVMPFTLPDLPFAKDALEPYISSETLEYHYGKHHQGYVDKLNNLIGGTPRSDDSLETIIMNADGGLFNNAAQVWNHTFYWHGLSKNDSVPEGALADAIERDFGSVDKVKSELKDAATSQFGSGWAWLVLDNGKLKVTNTLNADLPMRHNQTALWTVDVWEHAYYIDVRNQRAKYVDNVLDHLMNWDFVIENYEKANGG